MRLLFGLVLTLGLATAAAHAEPPPPVEMADAIVFLREPDGRIEPIQGTRFPLSPDRTCFGWRIVLATTAAKVQVRELYLLPGPATTWGYDPAITTVADDSASAVTDWAPEPLFGRLLNHTWCITEGDPLGFYRFKVYLNDVLAREFCFEAVAPEDFIEDPSTGSTGCAALLSLRPGSLRSSRPTA